MISQFETEVLRWNHANEKITKPISLQERSKLCDENYFTNINAVFPVGSCRANAVSALYVTARIFCNCEILPDKEELLKPLNQKTK